MEIIIRIYDRERLLEAKLQSGETYTIGKAAGCTIQLAAACLGKKTITVKTDGSGRASRAYGVPVPHKGRRSGAADRDGTAHDRPERGL